MFDIDWSDDGRVRLKGRFDASQVEPAAAVFATISTSCTLDCSELSYISSAGLGLLFATQKRLVNQGHELSLVALNPHIREIFKIAGFDHIFKIS